MSAQVQYGDKADDQERHGGSATRLAAYLLLASCSAVFVPQVANADPVPTPSFAGPLVPNPDPVTIDAGPFGEVAVTGQVSGISVLQSNATYSGGIGNRDGFVDLSNAQVEIQSTTGPLQFYVQAGAYSLPSLGSAYLRATKATDQLYGPVPVAYAKAVISPELSISGGLLPTMIGAESTFTFQNMNIERGLLWNQEPAISRGVQVNYARGPVSAAVSLNDGYFSGKFNWLSASLSYAIDGSNTVTLIGAGSLSRSSTSSTATPVLQNNSRIFNVIYSHTSGPLTLTPYFQYSHVERDTRLGIDRSASTYGGAVLAKYTFDRRWSLAARGEYLKTTGGTCGSDPNCAPTNLLYGAKSDAWSLTATPTYQSGIFFVRGELSYTRIGNLAAGAGFGRNFDRRDQARALVETGFLF
ncbi:MULTISPECIES: outer membrane beta-barrel protein [unclassified Sphingomonas]|jgi:hypothetical protein|uniref:outer membrane beta-barrel protein n=1 Tax=unclassified Sphingomonas TaxID=196159 RepID=UPI0010F5F4E7|nr:MULTISPECIES: outer membrane beta-barrel protein [unclassified Sphingomonas]MBI0533304.1 porin [Sphingomonas sp. TX0522]